MRYLIVAFVAIGLLSACGKSSTPTVPRLAGGSASASAGSSTAPKNPNIGGPATDARRAALHTAAECIRQHGIPTYKDPVMTGDGDVYTDARSVQDAGDATLAAVQQACGSQIAAAQFQPDNQAAAPPKLVAAGVKAAQCLRANGLPKVTDPTSSTLFTPGHGFGLNGDALPAAGKQDPVVQRAFAACRTLLNEETRLSDLGSLAGA